MSESYYCCCYYHVSCPKKTDHCVPFLMRPCFKLGHQFQLMLSLHIFFYVACILYHNAISAVHIHVCSCLHYLYILPLDLTYETVCIHLALIWQGVLTMKGEHPLNQFYQFDILEQIPVFFFLSHQSQIFDPSLTPKVFVNFRLPCYVICLILHLTSFSS